MKSYYILKSDGLSTTILDIRLVKRTNIQL